ncbi:glycosyltransferase family 4 protein [Falsihalocynthiibacter sp. BN13B15]|uniref:glycosyltransferase family 4 protein n=1 Tax=Falsihalocynthiibacter sp. BN13B15 TaxID=3240871 RepID=UPI00350F8998
MKVIVIFDSLGPYHVARLQALAPLCNLLAIEVYMASHDYAWLSAGSVPFQKITLDDVAEVGVDPLRALRKTLSTEQPDIIFVPGWSSRFALEALAWARLRGVPAVVMSDSQMHDNRRSTWSETLKSWIVKRFSGALVAGSPHVKYARALGVPSQLIRTGYDVVDNDHFAAGAARARAEPARYWQEFNLPKRYFLVSARFIQKKNLPWLLRTFQSYRQSCPNAAPWDLVLMGDGPMRPDLERQILDSGLQGAVHLLGFRQYEETPIVFGLADALILPSTSEQWGLVVNEAMATGLPALVSDRCGSAPDLVIEGKTGFTFNPEDEGALLSLMLKLSSLPEMLRERMGIAAKVRIGAFSPEFFASNAMDLAQQVIKGSHQPSIDGFAIRLIARTRGRN